MATSMLCTQQTTNRQPTIRKHKWMTPWQTRSSPAFNQNVGEGRRGGIDDGRGVEIVGDSRALRVNSYFPLPLIYFLCIITREVGRSRRGSQLSFDRIAPSSGSFVPFFFRGPLGPVSRCTGTVTFCDVLCVTRNSRHEHNLG